MSSESEGDVMGSVRIRRPAPLRGFLGRQRRLDRAQIRGPRSDFAAVGDGLRSVRVVQAEDSGLGEGVGRAQTRRMLRISFDFGRSAHVALDQHRPRDAPERDGARKEQGPAGHQIFGLPDVRDDLLRRLRRAGADAGERERGAHQLEEVAPALRIVPFRCLLREFTVQVVAEVRSVGQLAQAPPVKAALRPCETRSDCSEVHMVAISSQLSALSFPRSSS